MERYKILVCVAVLCSFRTTDDSAKLIMIFLCLFIFITTGFEGSVANMTICPVALISATIQGATLAGALYNLVAVTLGNMVGGLIVMGAGVYILGSEKKEADISINTKAIKKSTILIFIKVVFVLEFIRK